MANDGPIILIDDDDDDLYILKKILKAEGVPNVVRHFTTGEEALAFLKSMDEKAFLILSDINMPKMDGMELQAAINMDPSLKAKCIPFVFFTTSATQHAVEKAYQSNVQGFFEKGNTLEEITRKLKMIVEYWTDSKHPND